MWPFKNKQSNAAGDKPPSCVDCEYFFCSVSKDEPLETRWLYSCCKRPVYSPVLGVGVPLNERCWSQRKFSGRKYCGPEGRFFSAGRFIKP